MENRIIDIMTSEYFKQLGGTVGVSINGNYVMINVFICQLGKTALKVQFDTYQLSDRNVSFNVPDSDYQIPECIIDKKGCIACVTFGGTNVIVILKDTGIEIDFFSEHIEQKKQSLFISTEQIAQRNKVK